VNVPLPPRRQAGAPAPGPQAAAPAVQPGQPAPAAGKVSEIISDTQRLAPASSAGFVKQP
jgi:hypothetical protein